MVEKHSKDFVLNNNNLADEQKVTLFNEFLKTHIFKINKAPDVAVDSATKLKTTHFECVWSIIENLTHPTTRSILPG